MFSGTLSDRSHGCMPRKVMMLLTASVEEEVDVTRIKKVKHECVLGAAGQVPSFEWMT